MKRKKKISLFCLLSLTLVLLASCGNKSLAEQDILTRIETTPKIIWGVKNDTRLFGLMNIETRKVEGFDIDIASALMKEILALLFWTAARKNKLHLVSGDSACW